MNKILQLLILLAAFLVGSKVSFAQSIKDKAIFEKTFKDISEKNKAYKAYRYVSANGTIIITYNELTEKSYNATRISKAKRNNFDGFKKDTIVYVLNSKSLIKGSFQTVDTEFIFLKINDKVEKYDLSIFDYILTDIEKQPAINTNRL